MEDNRVAVLLERIESQLRLLAEGQEALRAKVDANGADIGSLRAEVRQTAIGLSILRQENASEHQQMIQMIRELDLEQQALKASGDR